MAAHVPLTIALCAWRVSIVSRTAQLLKPGTAFRLDSVPFAPFARFAPFAQSSSSFPLVVTQNPNNERSGARLPLPCIFAAQPP